MAQWRGTTPAPEHGLGVRGIIITTASGPASPLREGASPSLQLEIPFDVDDQIEAYAGDGRGAWAPKTPRTATGRKRGLDDLPGPAFHVPTPKKASPDGRDKTVPMHRAPHLSLIHI